MFMSLRKFLGYNIDDVTIWEHIITDEKDNLGRPLKKMEKNSLQRKMGKFNQNYKKYVRRQYFFYRKCYFACID